MQLEEAVEPTKPAACLSCKLYETASSFCIKPEFDLRSVKDSPEYGVLDTRPPIIVVGSHPGAAEDEKGKNFCSKRGGGEFLRLWLNSLEMRWILTSATRCYGGKEEKDGKLLDKKPTDRQAQVCSGEFVQDLINKHNPRVIVCLGAKAAKGVLGKAAPTKITSAKAPIPVPGTTNLWAICTTHPGQHDDGSRGDGTDLSSEYERVFELAEEVTMRGYVEQTVKYNVVRNLLEAQDVVTNKMRNVTGFSLDIETGVDFSKKNPLKMSIWHPEATFLCMSITWYANKEYVTYVFPVECLNAHIIRAMVKGRVIKGHNIKYEIQGIWKFFNVDIYELAEDVIDTCIRLYLPDQDRADIGLKDYSQQTWGIHNWESKAWEEIAEKNELIAVQNEYITKDNRKRLSLRKRLLKGETHYKVMVPNPDKPGRNMGMMLAIPSMEDLLPIAKLPANSADFGDIKRETLFYYNSFDTVFTEKIDQESKDATPDPLAWEHNKRAIGSLARTERKGLLANKERLSRLKHAHSYMFRSLQAVLLNQPEVQRVIEALPSYPEMYMKWHRRGFVDRNEVLDLVKAFGYKFYEEFVKQTVGVEGFPLAKSKKRLSSTKADFFELAKIEKVNDKGEVVWKSTIPEEDRTRNNDLWRLLLFCRVSYGMQSKFLDSLLKYITPDGRIRTSYRMTRIAKSGRSGGADETGGAASGRLASCIARGTHVDVLRDKQKHPKGILIENVKPGDLVYSYDEEGDLHLREVLKKASTGVRETVSLHYTAGDVIGQLILTPEHKVLTLLYGWVEAERLLPGTLVRAFIRGQKVCAEIMHVAQGPAIEVFDLLVDGTACFLANGLAVHNSDPNLQNLAHDKLLRSCIIAADGKVLVEFDFDRIEPVVLSVVADIKAWKEIFRRQLDLYRVIANKVLKLGISLEGPDDVVRAALEWNEELKTGVHEDIRSVAKTSTLAIMYEQSARAFAARMGIDEQAAIQFFREFDVEFPEIPEYKKKVREAVRNGELITTLFKRKRSFPLIGFNIDPEEQYRRAINFNIQASASDITIWKLWEIYEWMDRNNLCDAIHPVNVVHDAIWFEVDEHRLEELLPQVASIMEDMTTLPFEFDGQLLTTVKKGRNLGKMKKYKLVRLEKLAA